MNSTHTGSVSTPAESTESALERVATDWVQLHSAISTALGLEFAPDEDIERYAEAIADLTTRAEKAEAECAALRQPELPPLPEGVRFNEVSARYEQQYEVDQSWSTVAQLVNDGSVHLVETFWHKNDLATLQAILVDASARAERG